LCSGICGVDSVFVCVVVVVFVGVVGGIVVDIVIVGMVLLFGIVW